MARAAAARVPGEIIFISALILLTRCANCGDVFFGGQLISLMPIAIADDAGRICLEHPGRLSGDMDFENFPKERLPTPPRLSIT